MWSSAHSKPAYGNGSTPTSITARCSASATRSWSLSWQRAAKVFRGEPLLQPCVLGWLLCAIWKRHLATDIELETSGTIAPTDTVTSAVMRFNVSPKLAQSGLRRHQRIRPAVLKRLAASGNATWKFVVQNLDDLDEIQERVATYDLHPAWVIPEGTDSATVLTRMPGLAYPVLARGWHLSPRLRTLLWENDRGR